MTISKKILLPIIIASVLSLSFVDGNYFEIDKNLKLFSSLFKELNKSYVDELQVEKMMHTGIDAMLESLDPYTTFYPEEDIEGFKMQMTGKYGGIGALIRKQDDYVIIAEPYEGFPAHDARLIAGDKIIEIDGVPFKGKSTEDVSNTLRGTPGSKVDLVIEKPGSSKKVKLTLTREEIKISSVPYYGMIDDIGYVILNSFTNDCSSELKDAIVELKKNNPKGLILDLRSNPGGLLNEAVNVSNLFIDKGKEVVRTKGKEENSDKPFKTRRAGFDTEIPLVVLTSGGSASASEIVSGVMQDYDRGVIVGEKTFGKGLVQSTKDIGYNSKLKLTTAKYYLPSGRCIQAIDYSGKYKDGAVKVPDSLRTKYKTIAGRIVRDAGGIDPDVEVEDEEFSKLVMSLYIKQYFFHYATDFVQKNPSIASPSEFKVTDEIYADFSTFLSGKDYDYKTQSEILLEELKKRAEKEEIMDQIKENVESLETKIKHDKAQDLIKYKSQVSEFLEGEIVTRYYNQKGRIEASLDTDPFVLEAVETLKDPAKYKKLLSN